MDKHRLTQVGRAMKELGVQMIAAYSPQARGRSRAQFRNLAGAPAAGVATGRNHHTWKAPMRSCARRYISGVQPEVHGGGGGERDGISPDGADGT